MALLWGEDAGTELVLLGLLQFSHVYVLADKQVSSYAITLIYLLCIGGSTLSRASRQAHCLKVLHPQQACAGIAWRSGDSCCCLDACKRAHKDMCACTWHFKHMLTLGHAVARSSWTTISFCPAARLLSTTR